MLRCCYGIREFCHTLLALIRRAASAQIMATADMLMLPAHAVTMLSPRHADTPAATEDAVTRLLRGYIFAIPRLPRHAVSPMLRRYFSVWFIIRYHQRTRIDMPLSMRHAIAGHAVIRHRYGTIRHAMICRRYAVADTPCRRCAAARTRRAARRVRAWDARGDTPGMRYATAHSAMARYEIVVIMPMRRCVCCDEWRIGGLKANSYVTRDVGRV